MPSLVRYITVTVFPLAGDKVTGNSAVPPSVTAGAFPIDTSGGSSSSVIVPVRVLVPSVASSGSVSSRVNVSVSGSSAVSWRVRTSTVLLSVPGAKISVPLAPV